MHRCPCQWLISPQLRPPQERSSWTCNKVVSSCPRSLGRAFVRRRKWRKQAAWTWILLAAVSRKTSPLLLDRTSPLVLRSSCALPANLPLLWEGLDLSHTHEFSRHSRWGRGPGAERQSGYHGIGV